MVETKYIKIGIAATAVVAISIGLGVGLSSNKASRKVSSSNNTEMGMEAWNIDDACLSSSKSGKSSGGEMSMTSGKSGKSGGGSNKSDMTRRVLVVPGTEEYHEKMSAGKTLERRLGSKSSKSGCGSSKSGKSSRPCTEPTPPMPKPEPEPNKCPPILPGMCTTKSGKSAGKGDMSMGSGKSGKSAGKGDMSMGSGKSGKSGGGAKEEEGKSGSSKGTKSATKSATKSSEEKDAKSNKSSPSPGPTICTSAKSSKASPTPPQIPPAPTPFDILITPGPSVQGTTTVATDKVAEETQTGDRDRDGGIV